MGPCALLMRADLPQGRLDHQRARTYPQRSSNSGGAHETQRCPQPPWLRGGVVAAEGERAAGGDAGDRHARGHFG
jgi:hypothetical protein